MPPSFYICAGTLKLRNEIIREIYFLFSFPQISKILGQKIVLNNYKPQKSHKKA